MSWKIKTAALALAGALSVGFSAGAAAASFVLPTPENNPNATYGVYPDASGIPRQAILMDGIPIAFKYDDMWSYSGHILESIQTVNPALIPTATFGAYNFSTGTGVILVNLSSVAGGATNPFNLQDPVNLSGGGDGVTGWECAWGGDPQTCSTYVLDKDGNMVLDAQRSYSSEASKEGTTSTVGEMLAALQSMNPTWTIPVIYADYNQTGGGDSLFMSAQIKIVDLNGNIVKSWELDALTNTAWDKTSPTYNFGDITFTNAANCASIGLWNPITGTGCAGVTTSGLTYTGSHNKGSGKADFMAFAPDMDLSLYDSNFLFIASVNLGCNLNGRTSGLVDTSKTPPEQTDQGCNTNGYEEFGIIGGQGPTNNNPEPSSLALMGLGLAAAAFAGRRRQRR
jgi:hypothetical protein